MTMFAEIISAAGREVRELTADEIAAFEQAPPPAIPQSVTPRQARLALLQSGLLEAVESAIATMEGDAGRAARIEWEFSQEIRRDNAMLQSVQAALGLTDDQVNDLFILASTI